MYLGNHRDCSVITRQGFCTIVLHSKEAGSRSVIICDCIWESSPCNEILVTCSHIFYKLYPRAYLPPSLGPITRFAQELECFVYNHVTPTIYEKLRPKGVAMYAYSISIYYAYTRSQSMSTWVEPFKMNTKVKPVLNFVVSRAAASPIPKKLNR